MSTFFNPKYLIIEDFQEDNQKSYLFDSISEIGEHLGVNLRYIDINDYYDDSISPKLAALRFLNDIYIEQFDVSECVDEAEEERFLEKSFKEYFKEYKINVDFPFVINYFECGYVQNSDCENIDVFMLDEQIFISEQGSLSGTHISEAFLNLKNAVRIKCSVELFELV